MKYQIKKGSVEASKVTEVGAPFVQDDERHPNHGLLPVQCEHGRLEPVPDGLPDDPARVQAIARNASVVKAAQRLFPKGSQVEVGDYIVNDRIVDGPFFESITAAAKEE